MKIVWFIFLSVFVTQVQFYNYTSLENTLAERNQELRTAYERIAALTNQVNCLGEDNQYLQQSMASFEMQLDLKEQEAAQLRCELSRNSLLTRPVAAETPLLLDQAWNSEQDEFESDQGMDWEAVANASTDEGSINTPSQDWVGEVPKNLSEIELQALQHYDRGTPPVCRLVESEIIFKYEGLKIHFQDHRCP